VDGEPVVFLFNDTQIVQEGFLEDINNMLNSGEDRTVKRCSAAAHEGMQCMQRALLCQI
jgi:hypothetical protein